MRKNKGLSKDELKQEYEKLLFVNRQIAEKSHDNAIIAKIQSESKILKKLEALIKTIKEEKEQINFGIEMNFLSEQDYNDFIDDVNYCKKIINDTEV